MATRAPSQSAGRPMGGAGRSDFRAGNADRDSVGLEATGHSSIAILAAVLASVALCLAVGLTMVAYIETLWMKAEIKQEARELRKLKQEFKETSK